jgi:hypothetical protein
MTLTFLTRAYCHLCDDMRGALAPLLAGRSVTLVELDVDADPALEARYGELVPVLILAIRAAARSFATITSTRAPCGLRWHDDRAC